MRYNNAVKDKVCFMFWDSLETFTQAVATCVVPSLMGDDYDCEESEIRDLTLDLLNCSDFEFVDIVDELENRSWATDYLFEQREEVLGYIKKVMGTNSTPSVVADSCNELGFLVKV